jgi:hypothetical protein
MIRGFRGKDAEPIWRSDCAGQHSIRIDDQWRE